MFCAPAVACEISAPPTTPRGTSRSGPGLTTLMGASLLAPRDLDLQRWLGGRLVVHLKRGVRDVELLFDQTLQRASKLVAIIAGSHHDVCREGGKAGGDLPHVQIVNLYHSGLRGQHAADLIGAKARRRRFHEH